MQQSGFKVSTCADTGNNNELKDLQAFGSAIVAAIKLLETLVKKVKKRVKIQVNTIVTKYRIALPKVPVQLF